MKDSLIQITQQIIDSNEISVDKFQVFEETDTLPEAIENIVFQSEYLVCLWVNCNDAFIAKEQYESFIHKPVGVVKNHQHNVLYWFEGLKRKAILENQNEDPPTPIIKEKIQVESLKNDSILPTWLQQMILKYTVPNMLLTTNDENNLNLSDDELKYILHIFLEVMEKVSNI